MDGASGRGARVPVLRFMDTEATCAVDLSVSHMAAVVSPEPSLQPYVAEGGFREVLLLLKLMLRQRGLRYPRPSGGTFGSAGAPTRPSWVLLGDATSCRKAAPLAHSLTRLPPHRSFSCSLHEALCSEPLDLVRSSDWRYARVNFAPQRRAGGWAGVVQARRVAGAALARPAQ